MSQDPFDDSIFDDAPARRPGIGINAPLDPRGRTALHIAAEKKDFNGIAKLIRAGANPNAQDKEGRTPIYEAVSAGDLDMARYLLDLGATLRVRDDAGMTPFERAVKNDAAPSFLDGLRALGALLEANPRNGRTALHIAAENGRAGLVGYLSAAGIPVDAQDDEGYSALHLAVSWNDVPTTQALLAQGAGALLRTKELKTPLHIAAEKGFEVCARLLLDREEVRTSLNDYRTYQEGFTPLLSAVYNNQPEMVELLSSLGADVNLRDNQNRNGLFIAAEYGHLGVARRLIRLGADVEKSEKSVHNKTGIAHWISSKNYREMLLLLYSSGIDINATDGSGQTALHRACDYNDREKILALLDIGADPNPVNEFGKRPIDVVMDHYSYGYEDKPEIIARMLSCGANPDISPAPEMKCAPLHIAARHGHRDTLHLLLKHHARVDEADKTEAGLTPFLAAAANGQLEAMRILLAAGADPARRDKFDRNALHLAARDGDADVVSFLLDQKAAGIDARDGRGRTALIHACRREKVPAVKTLLQRGADWRLQDEDGWNALHHAAEAGSPLLLSAFEEAGVGKTDLNALSGGANETALHIAARKGLQMPVEKLLEMGADPALAGSHGLLPIHFAILFDNGAVAHTLINNMKHQKIHPDQYKDRTGMTLLHYAATKDNPQIVSVLIAAGADIHARDESGDTALHIAARFGNQKVVDYLVNNKGADIGIANKAGKTALHLAVENGRQETAGTLVAAFQKHAAVKTPTGTSGKKTRFKPPGIL